MSSKVGSIIRGDSELDVVDLSIDKQSSYLFPDIDIVEMGINVFCGDSDSSTIISMNFNNYLTSKSKN
jgi:hypothetical protein